MLRELELVTLTPAIRAERGIRRAERRARANVSAARRRELGLQAGDVIVQINRIPIADARSSCDARSTITPVAAAS